MTDDDFEGGLYEFANEVLAEPRLGLPEGKPERPVPVFLHAERLYCEPGPGRKEVGALCEVGVESVTVFLRAIRG